MKKLQSVLILPCSEQTGSLKDIIEKLKAVPNPPAPISSDIEKIENGLLHFPMDKHFALVDGTCFATSYIDEDTIIILDNDKRCLRKMNTVLERIRHHM